MNSFNSAFNSHSNTNDTPVIFESNPSFVIPTVTPLTINNTCVLWLDACDILGDNSYYIPKYDGSKISIWNNKASTGNTCDAIGYDAISSSLSKVTCMKNKINNLPAFSFTNENNKHFRGNITGFSSTTDIISIFAVSILNSDTDAGRIIGLSPLETTPDQLISTGMAFNHTNNNYTVSRRSTKYYKTAYPTTVQEYDKPYIGTCFFNGSTGYLNALVGSTTTTDITWNDTSATILNPTKYAVGSNVSNTDAYGRLNGFISEIIVYNSYLTTNPRQKVEGYLSWKWGLQGNLPANHPYKTTAPT